MEFEEDVMKPTRYPNFDYLRPLLALTVAYAHAYLFPVAIPLPLPVPVSPVPAFVCISGMVIPPSLLGSNGYGHFAWKRFLRVMPAFLISFLLIAILDGWRVLAPTFVFYLTMGMVAGVGANAPLWSLALEEVLYAFHATIKRVFTRTFAATCFVVSVVASMALGSQHWGHMSASLILTAAASFFAGNCLYFWPPNRTAITWVIAGLAFASSFLMPPSLNYLSIIVGAVSLIALAAALPQLPISSKWVDVSYGLYIYHWPILGAMIRLGFRGGGLFCATMSLTLPLAYLSWTFVEKVAMKYKNSPPRLHFWKPRRAGEMLRSGCLSAASDRPVANAIALKGHTVGSRRNGL